MEPTTATNGRATQDEHDEHPPRAGAMDPYIEQRDPTPFVERLPTQSPFPPIADYGFLSDCHTAALVAPDGTVEWLCPPRFDAPSVFAAILDRSGGGFRLGPSSMGVPAGRRYEPGHQHPRDDLDDADRLARRPRRAGHRPLARAHRRAPPPRTPARRPTTSPTTSWCARSPASTARPRSRCSASRCSTTAACPSEWERVEGDVDERRRHRRRRQPPAPHRATCVSASRARSHARATACRPARRATARSRGRGCSTARAPPRRRPRALQTTSEYWRGWLADGKFPDHRWRGHLAAQRARPQGPHLRADRRDGRRADDVAARDPAAASATGTTATPGCATRRSRSSALNSLGLEWEADDFIQFVADADRNEDGSLQIMYGIGGERELHERELDHLTGYENARPVRVGNGAHDQRQNDVYGAVLDSIYLHTKEYGHNSAAAVAGHRGPGQARDRHLAAARPGDLGGPRRAEALHVIPSSCAGWRCDRGARLAARRGKQDLADAWREVANEIHAEICEQGVDDRGVFTQHYETDVARRIATC